MQIKKFFFIFLVFSLIIGLFQISNIKQVYATAITKIQGNYRGTGLTTPINVTMGSTPTNGNVLIACIHTSSGTTYSNVTSIADGNSHITWTVQKTKSFLANAYEDEEIWLGIIASGASVTQTVTLSTNPTVVGGIVDICEFSGIATSNFLDVTANNYTLSGNILSTGTTATTTKSNELWIGDTGGYRYGAVTLTQYNPTNNFTLLDGADTILYSTYHSTQSFLYKIVSSTGIANSGTTCLTTLEWAGCIATFYGGTNLTENGVLTLSQSLDIARSETFTRNGLNIISLTQTSQKTFAKNIFDNYIENFYILNMLPSPPLGLIVVPSSHVFTLYGILNFNLDCRLSGYLPYDYSTIVNMNFSITFVLLIIMIIASIILSVFRIPIIGFIVSLFTLVFSIYALSDTTLPFYPNPIFSAFGIAIGAICFFLNANKFYELGKKKRGHI